MVHNSVTCPETGQTNGRFDNWARQWYRIIKKLAKRLPSQYKI